MEATIYHTPVLQRETLSFLLTSPDGLYLDCTLGGGGHAEAVLRSLKEGRLIGFDRDADAIAQARKRLDAYGERFLAVRSSFGDVTRQLSRLGIAAINGILLDLGVSSHHLDEPGRGFSFQADGPLDMRMDRQSSLSAKEVVNGYSEETLTRVFRTYGEEPNARRIAREVARHRPVLTTRELAQIIGRIVQGPRLTKTLARIFQAIRIEVNKEIEELQSVLKAVPDLLLPGGRVVVLTYHSLEDRVVKDFFRAHAAVSDTSISKFLPDTPLRPDLKIITRKPVTAGEEERGMNPRARSAKLRAAERI